MAGNANSGMAVGKMRIMQPQLARVRGMRMMEDKLTGMTNAELGKKYNIHPATVGNILTKIANEGVLEEATDRLINQMVPVALDAIMSALKDGNAKVALEVLKGTNVMKKPSVAQSNASQSEEGDSLELYIRKKLPNATAGAASVDTVALPEQTIIDIEPLPEAKTGAGESQSDLPDE